MLKRLIAFGQGRVFFVAQGKELSRFLNELIKDKVGLYRTRQYEKGMRAQVQIRDFARMRRAARLTHTRIHIVAKYGWPFLLQRWQKRKALAAGIAMAVIMLAVVSQFVLSVGVSGNSKIDTQTILTKAKAMGLQVGVRYGTLDYEQLGQALQEQLPEAAWVGVERSGTHIQIKVVEKKQPVVPVGSGDLVANRTGLVEEIMVIQGTAQVQEQQMVRQGQVLIKGLSAPPVPYQIVGNNGSSSAQKQNTPKPDESEEAKAYASAAKGFVRGRVWYSSEATVPRVEDKIEETGNVTQGWGIKIGSKVIMVKAQNSPYAQSTQEVSNHSLPAWRNWHFPVELVTIKYKEQHTVHIERTQEEARTLGEELAKKEVQAQIASNAKVLDEKVKILPSGNDAERVRVEVETYEDLAVYANP